MYALELMVCVCTMALAPSAGWKMLIQKDAGPSTE